MKRINIYIDNKDKKRLNELKNKYHLSYSTIVNIIAEKYYMILSTKLQDCYLYGKENTYKTSIKPRGQERYEHPSFLYTNATRIFTKNELSEYVQDKTLIQKVNNFIYEEFDKTWDENWDGNHLQRSMPKIIKQNREYYRRILDEE